MTGAAGRSTTPPCPGPPPLPRRGPWLCAGARGRGPPHERMSYPTTAHYELLEAEDDDEDFEDDEPGEDD